MNTPVGNPQSSWGGGVNSSKQAQFFLDTYPNRPLDVVIDIGANSGSVGFHLLHHGAKHCVFVEPLLEERLRQKVREQHCEERTVIIPKAVAKEGGLKLRFRSIGDGQSGFLFKEGGPWWGHAECEVETISFVDLLSHYDKIDFLKIDIEGGEWNFLAPDDDVVEQLMKVHYMDLEIHVGGTDYEGCMKGLDFDMFHPYYRQHIKPGMDMAGIRNVMIDWLVDIGFERPKPDDIQKQGKEFSFNRIKW